MPAITENQVRSLAAIRSDGSAITSCYLDIDGRRYVRPVDYERVLDQMLRQVRSNGAAASTEQDLERIESVVKAGFDRSVVRGVAIFSNAADELWEIVELPVAVRSEIVVDSAPAVGQLEAVVQQATTIGVLMADKAHARVFVYRLGELIGQSEVTDDLGRDYDTVGEHDRGGVDDHREEMWHQHLRNAAALAWSAHQDHGIDHVVVAVPDRLATELEGNLHPYLRERLHQHLDLEPTAPETAIRAAALEVAATIKRDREVGLVEELRAAVASDGRAVAGLEPVLDALAEQRVERLLVSDGYAVEGWRCGECGRLATVGRECPACGSEMEHLGDMIERAVDDALIQSANVDVCLDCVDLDVMGRIGAFLRY